MFFVFQILIIVFSHVFIDSEDPSSEDTAHWHMSWAPSFPVISILNFFNGVLQDSGQLLIINCPRFDIWIVSPSKHVGLISSSIDPRTVLIPIHTSVVGV